jgi:1,4-dihydroxy-2-naphthoyl-CoA hydrolase
MWKKSIDLNMLNQQGQNTAVSHLGIEITEVGEDFVRGTLPVDERSRQPFGLLHGGASVLLAETLGSIAGNLAVDAGQACVGLDINANHVRSVRQGTVTGTARAMHLGRNTQVWQIDIRDEQQKLVCTSRLTLAVIAMP